MTDPDDDQTGSWSGSSDEGSQDTFDDVLFAEERQAWARRRRCRHCYIWAYDKKSDEFMIACAHGCGSIRHKWKSVDPDGDRRRVKATQEAFMIAHAYGGCPRDISRLPGGTSSHRLPFPRRK